MWKNTLLRTIVHTVKPRSLSTTPNSFLIVSTTGLGDTLWATAPLRTLREAFPDAYVGCLTSSVGAEVLRGNPHLSEIFVMKNALSACSLFAAIKKKKIETALIFHASQRTPLPLCVAAGIERVIGTRGLQKGLDDLLTDACPWTTGHEIERRMELIKKVGGRPSSYEMEFFIQEEDRQAARQLVPEPFAIGLHPGAKDRFKQWPAKHFIRVGQTLRAQLGCTIVVTGSPSEASLVFSICAHIPGSRPIIAPLYHTAAVLEKLALFITNDTGPLHLALAMKTKTLSLFVPTDPAMCGPYHTAGEVLKSRPTCFPCLKKKCQDPFCLQQIGPDRVIAAALKSLGSP